MNILASQSDHRCIVRRTANVCIYLLMFSQNQLSGEISEMYLSDYIRMSHHDSL